MKINKINPQSYCSGVMNAINLVMDNYKNYPKPIYMLGKLIHNDIVMNKFKELGIIILDDKSKTRLELLDEISSGTVIISAHGVSDKVIEKAKNKGLNIIDSTCPYVKKISNNIKEYLNKGYDIIYIGTKGHPEVEGVLGISNNINLITNINDINNLNINNDKIYITNQTTLSIIEIENIYNLLKNKFPSSIIDNKICLATTKRQEAIINQEPVDLCIIVGDINSSNTKKLYELAKDNNIKATMCDSLNTLDKSLLEGIKSVSISSGASTPIYLVDEIIEYINKKC